MGYSFTDPEGHAAALARALHNLRRHVQDGEPLDEFYLDVPQLLETAVDYISADVDREAERLVQDDARSRCPHGIIINRNPVVPRTGLPLCSCCRRLYVYTSASAERPGCSTCR